MSLLSVVKNVCLVVGMKVPDQVMASTLREMQEMARLANEMAEMIAAKHEWQALQVAYTFTGDGTSEAFTLPTDYGRMPVKANLWSSKWQWELNQIADTDGWLEYQVWPATLILGNWIIYADEMHVLPIMGAGEQIRFFYLSNKLMKASVANGGATKAAFTDDTDTFRLNERLLELALIWKWKSDKGQPSDDRLNDFEEKLLELKDQDKGSKPVISGAPRLRSRTNTFPFPVGQNTL